MKTITYTAPPTETIETTAENMVALAKKTGCFVRTEFNGRILFTNAATPASSIVVDYWKCGGSKKKPMGSPAYDQCVVDALRALVNKIDLEASEGHPLHPMNYPEHTWGIDGYPDELERAREILREIDANS